MPKAQPQTFQQLLPSIKKDLGDAIMCLGDEPDFDVPRLKTGILALDKALGGGLPKGRMVEIFGIESSGKTSIAMITAAQAQKEGTVILIDAENAFDPTMALNSGVDLDALYVAQPATLEATFELLESVGQVNDVSCVIVDSVAALVPRAELEGDYGDANMGVVAKLLSTGLRKLNNKLVEADSDMVIIWINQLRELMNVMGYGPKTTTPGGRGLRYFCSTRIEVKKIGAVKHQDEVIGHNVKAVVVKNRSAPPGKEAVYEILYETGVSNEGTVLDLAEKEGLIVRKGAWYSNTTTGEQLGQGRLAVLARLREDKELMSSLTEKILL